MWFITLPAVCLKQKWMNDWMNEWNISPPLTINQLRFKRLGLFMSIYHLHLEVQNFCFVQFRILIFYDGVEMAFEMPGSMPHFKGNKKGRVYLTTHRVSCLTFQNQVETLWI